MINPKDKDYTLTITWQDSQIIRFCLLTYANEIKEELRTCPRNCIKADKYNETIQTLARLADKVKAATEG